jgi:hypothetical protein
VATEPLNIHRHVTDMPLSGVGLFGPGEVKPGGARSDPRDSLPAAVPPEKPKRHAREIQLRAIGGARSNDAASGEKRFLASVPLDCYYRREAREYAGSVDWEVIFSRAAIPDKYRPAWRQLVASGAKAADIPDAHYRWIWRVCKGDGSGARWRRRILSVIQEQRRIDPDFGVPHLIWKRPPEFSRTPDRERWHPVAQGSVSTICSAVSVSATLYWKKDDKPGVLTRGRRTRTVRRVIVSCDGFTANFQGARLEAYGESFRAGIGRLISDRWIPSNDSNGD